MSLAIETEVYSIGTEPLEVLGFQSEKDLEEALFHLMQEAKQEGFTGSY